MNTLRLAGLTVSGLVLASVAFAAPPKPHKSDHAPKAAQSEHHDDAQWSYTGPSGPEHWGDLAPENYACKAGHQQSPVDLTGPIPAFTGSPQIQWNTVHGGEVVNNGHTLQMNLEHAGGLVRDGVFYKLVQFHFHTPSEHTVNGSAYPMEVHFVHASEDGRLAVIGVMFAEGANNAALDPIWWSAPGTPGKAAVSFEFDPRSILPKNRAAVRYKGSLTTPPCSEIVDWTVMKTPLTASKTQITVFRSMFGNNARPVQPQHRRFLLETPQ